MEREEDIVQAQVTRTHRTTNSSLERDDVERVVRMEQSIVRLESKIDILLSVQEKQIDKLDDGLGDAENRIDKLEKWRYGIGGTLIVALISLFQDKLPFV